MGRASYTVNIVNLDFYAMYTRVVLVDPFESNIIFLRNEWLFLYGMPSIILIILLYAHAHTYTGAQLLVSKCLVDVA